MADDRPQAQKHNLESGPALGAEFAAGELVGGRYRVISCLGRGGMGVVYKVEQVFLHEQLALKTLLSNNASDTSIRRFQLEGRATFSLDHPNLISVSDLGILDDGTPFLVMELITGQTLADYLRKRGRLHYKEAAKIFARICLGLAHAHHKGVVHRDIKPSNLMLTGQDIDAEDCVKVMDFGIAKIMRNEVQGAQELTKTGEVMGSPIYMSPEQCSGTMVDFRSDIYSLGCVFFECLTGAPPFIGDSALSTLTKHLSETPPTLKEASLGIDFPPALEAMVAQMLAKSPEDRYQDLGNLAIDLAALTKEDTTSAQQAIAIPLSLRRKKKTDTVSVAKKTLAALIAAPFVVAAATAAIVYAFCKPTADNTRIAAVPIAPGEAVQTPPDQPGDGVGKFPGSQPMTFSKVDRRDGKEVRIFNFGEDRFGRLSLLRPWLQVGKDGRDDIPLSASSAGDIVVPIDARVRLTLNLQTLLQHPDWINRFGKNDLTSLKLESTSDNTAFSADTEQISYDELMSFLSNLNSLEELQLEKVPISIFGLNQMHIEKFSRLHVLNIGTSNIDGHDLAKMPHLLMRLDFLQIDNMRHASDVLAVLQHSPKIQVLFAESVGLTDADMDYISRMENLQVLGINSNEEVTDRGLAKLSRLKTLCSLWAAGCSISPSAVPILSKFSHLKGLLLPAKFRGHEAELKAALPKDCLCRYGQ
jgi:tRNA A-37 threonylcarbamoyl transferase component Bud32